MHRRSVVFVAALVLAACTAPPKTEPDPKPVEGAGVRITQAPPAATSARDAAFTVECEQDGCTIECRIDGAAFATCSSPVQYSGLAESLHMFEARAAGATGAPAKHEWSIDATGPTVTISSSPASLSNQSTANFALGCSDASCTFECSLDGAAASACSATPSFTALTDGSHAFVAVALDVLGNRSTPATYDWTIETQAPTVTFTTTPPSTTGSTSATFEWSCSENNCSFTCSLDGATAASCTSPDTRSSLADGTHTFTVVATDAAGNASAAATHSWTVNSTLPSVTLNAAPTALTNQTTATFAFSCSLSNCTFTCGLDGAPATSCTSPVTFNGLADGAHIFSIKATSSTGITGAATTHSWQVDTSPPTVSFSASPAAITNQTTASFTFSCDQAPCTFTCSLDGANATACTSPAARTGLAAGVHVFTVVATDAAGNSGSAFESWTVDLTPPTVSFTNTPPATTGATASFSFGCGETGCTFKCSLDGATATTCTSPQSFASLADGSHTFSVTATDAAGNTSTAATHTWTVNTALPAATLSTTTPTLTNQTGATFTFTCDQSNCTFECSLDGAAFAACTSPRSFTALTASSHTFKVRPVSASGTGAEQSFTWTIDTQAPTVTIGTPPANPTNATSASFTLTASETGCSFSCSLDGVSASCTSPAAYSSLAPGSHTFTVAATDTAGNAGTASSFTWIVDTTGPVVTLQNTPTNPSSSSSANISWTVNETGCSFTCSLDGATATSCTSPAFRSSLAAGSHSFTINSVDAAGNAGTPVTFSWTIDLTAPTVIVSAAPSSPTTATDATFTFSCNETPCTLTCTLDGAPTTCTSPRTLTGLADGTHTFAVRGVDAAGNSSSNVTRTWTVDTTPPQTSISSGPASGPGATSATFNFSANETSTFECSLDGAAFASCTSPASYTIALGAHTFQVRATDAVGNVDATPASWSWVAASTFISSISPSSGPVSVPMIIEGAGFGATQGSSAVTIGGAAATVRFWSDKYVVVMVPTGLPPGAATVSISPFTTATASYDVQPWVRVLSPLEPSPGAVLTLTGSSFGSAQGLVTIGQFTATIQSWSDTSVQVVVPASLKGSVGVVLGTSTGRKANVVYTTVRGSDVWVIRNGDVPEARDNATATWSGAELFVWGGSAAGNSTKYLNTGGRFDPVTGRWRSMSTVNAPIGRSNHTAIWTGTELIVFGGWSYNGSSFTYYGDGGRYDPVTDTWKPLAASGLGGRGSATAVWTGSQMIVFGGIGTGASYFNDGASYDPVTDTWKPLSATNAPAGRSNHTANWVNGEMIVWGGLGSFSTLHNTGARYNPSTDTWTAMTTSGAPAGRGYHTATWTGSELVVFGGGNASGTAVNTGGRYNPATNSWSGINFGPSARMNHTAVWTGSRVVVYGGVNGSTFTNTGSQYDPVGNTWTATSATNAATRSYHRAVWTGIEMLVYGSANPAVGRYDATGDLWSTSVSPPSPITTGTSQWTGSEMITWGGANSNQGIRYNPTTDTYLFTSLTGVPQGRTQPTSVWTGSQMIVWGGNNSGNYLNTGGRYSPVTDTWTAMSTVNAPVGRTCDSAWTGTEFIIWGGIGGFTTTYYATGGRYNPATDTWTTMSATGAPTGRWGHTMVWTGSELVIWGGYNSTGYQNNGARYSPATDTWTPISATGAPSVRSGMHAIWSGTDVVLYGGYGSNQYLGNGARYNPTTDTWSPLPTANSPGGREGSTGVWTGSELIVWGGRLNGQIATNDGSRFHAANNAWQFMTTTGAPPARYQHYAAWTGSEMVVFGGYGGGYGVALYLP